MDNDQAKDSNMEISVSARMLDLVKPMIEAKGGAVPRNLIHAIDGDSQLGSSILIGWNILSNDQVCEPGVAILLENIVDGCILDTVSSVLISQSDDDEALLVTDNWIFIRIEVERQHRSTEGAVEFITVH